MFKFVILIPSYNEEKTLNKILDKVRKYQVYVINDCSTDNTKNLKKKFLNVKFIDNKKNIGYENTLFKGFRILNKKNFDYIITMDADGEHSIINIKKVIYYCQKYSPDLIVGNRSRKNRYVEIIFSKLFYLRYEIFDPLSGFKIYKVKILKTIIENYEVKKHFLIDVLKLFIKQKKKISTINIMSNSKPKRKSKIGNPFFLSTKIIYCFKYLI
tara:strand:- start:48 stop:686 length:639 start_codon:yes stop_codon:yes gene_type:complete